VAVVATEEMVALEAPVSQVQMVGRVTLEAAHSSVVVRGRQEMVAMALVVVQVARAAKVVAAQEAHRSVS